MFERLCRDASITQPFHTGTTGPLLAEAVVQQAATNWKDSLVLPNTTNVTRWLLDHFISIDQTVHGITTYDRQPTLGEAGYNLGTSYYTGINHSMLPQLLQDASLQGAYARAWYDQRDTHSLPSYVAMANKQLVYYLTGATIRAYNHPLDATVDTKLQDYITSGTDITVAVFVLVGLSFLPAAVLVFVVKERVIKVSRRNLQYPTPFIGYA